MSEEVKNEPQLPSGNELILSSSPHIHDRENIQSIMVKVLLALMPAIFMGMWLFGADAIRVILLCSIFCVGAEILWCLMAGKPTSTVKDCSALVTGILLALNLSANVPWWLCLIGAILAIWLGKQIFGGLGHNPFNPALVARVGLLIGFPKLMTSWVPTIFMGQNTQSYSKAFFSDSIWMNVLEGKLDGITCATPLGLAGEAEKIISGAGAPQLFSGITTSEAYLNYFWGNVGGCIGEISAVALLLGGVILVWFKLIKWQIPLCYIGTVAVLSWCINLFFPGVTPPALFHLLTGGLLLGAIFMATDMVTSPMTGLGAVIFGIGCGLITCVIRIWGNYPEGVSFSILFMNALVPLIDRVATKKPFGYIKRTTEKGATA